MFSTCFRCLRSVSSTSMGLSIKQVSKASSNVLEPTLISRRSMFYEPGLRPDEKYEGLDRAWEELDLNEQLKLGWKAFKGECKKLREENRDLLTNDYLVPKHEPDLLYKHWDFRDEDVLNSWHSASDQDWDEGFSSVNWTRSNSGCALFSGHLDSRTLPRDGSVTRVGWVNVTCPETKRSFGRDDRYDFEGYTHLVMRVRGDGRTYAVILRCRGYFDITWYDIYTYGLYTTGGPYWQYVKIPFSKFCLTYKGAVQDIQEWIPLFNISTVGISLMDKNTGPFSLEIDFIGLMNDPIHDEKSAYEHYYIPDSPYKHET